MPDIASGQRRQIIRTIEMPVGQKQAIAFAKHLLPWRGHWKTKQHLIHFAVAVAANGNNAFRHAVQPLRHLTRRIPLRQRVARTVIEHIAEYDQPPAPLCANRSSTRSVAGSEP